MFVIKDRDVQKLELTVKAWLIDWFFYKGGNKKYSAFLSFLISRLKMLFQIKE